MRILSSEVSKHIGETVHIEGWLHKKRLLGGLTFISVRDRHGLTQIVLQDKDEVEKLRGLHIGTVLAVDGLAKEEPRAPGGADADPRSARDDEQRALAAAWIDRRQAAKP